MSDITATEAAEILEHEATIDNAAHYFQNPTMAKNTIKRVNVYNYAASMFRKIAAKELKPVVHAHWINTGYENSTGNIYRCSYCEKIYNPEKKAVEQTRQSEKPQFCPACGAIMDENKTEE